MKKKELKKRIKDLRELTDCLISDNVRLLMRLGDLPCCDEVKESFNYDDVPIPKKEYFKEDFGEKLKTMESHLKTEGAESESELKENAISLEVGKKYMTKNNYMVVCKEISENSIESQKYVMTWNDGTGYMCYSKEGKICTVNRDWDIVSEVKE